MAFPLTAQAIDVDFSNSTGLGTSQSEVVIQNIDVLIPIVNPFDPNSSSVQRATYNVRWLWDNDAFVLRPNGIVETTSGSANGSCANTAITVLDAIHSNTPISGATVEINGQYGTTDSSGVANFTGLPGAETLVRVNASGFISTDQAVSLSCASPNTNLQTFALSPTLTSGQFRVILTWAEEPRDLDSHMTGPQSSASDRFHVYYGSRSADMCSLDVDDTSGFGPETVTCPATADTTSSLRDGTYRYSVHQYSGSGDFSTSSARVEVILANGESYNFTPPATAYTGSKDVWTVFELTVQNGSVTVAPVNSVSNVSSASSIARPTDSSDTTPQFGREEDPALFQGLSK
jgi:hypothetical protein